MGNLSPFDELVFKKLQNKHSNSRHWVKTLALSVDLNIGDRSVRRSLTRLESVGVVARHGERGGWKPR